MTTTCTAPDDATIQLATVAELHEPQPIIMGPYEIKKLLGKGAMGEVYLAVHKNLERSVALKVLPNSLVENCSSVDRFQQEMKAVGRLDHRNVVRAHDADEHEGRHYIAMEYVDGRDLQQLIDETGPLPASVVCDLIGQAAAGLQHIHENGLVHRDIKPSNLMLSEDGVVKILDLGIAKLCDSKNAALTQIGTYFGTPNYISPEQIATTADVDIRADIYSLGCTAYQLLTGDPPYGSFEYETNMAKLIGHTKGVHQPVHTRLPNCPEGLSDVISRMMAVLPDDRFPEPIDVFDALQEWVETGNTMSELGGAKKIANSRRQRCSAESDVVSKGLSTKVKAGVAVLMVAIVCLVACLLPKNAIPMPVDKTPDLALERGVNGVENGVRNIDTNTGEIRDTLLRIESSMQAITTTTRSVQAPPRFEAISGTYRVEGTEPDGTDYTGKAMIMGKGDSYEVQWWYGEYSERGRGILQDDVFTVDWGTGAPALYRLQKDGRLEGTFDEGQGSETLIPTSFEDEIKATGDSNTSEAGIPAAE